MTREEFMHGWTLLTIQPWGKRFDASDDPDRAKLQFELYYSRLGYAHHEAWNKTALLFAGGDHWPVLDELSQSLSQCNKSYVPALEDQSQQLELDPEKQAEVEATLSRILGKPFKLPQ